jgi:hypothetical protein
MTSSAHLYGYGVNQELTCLALCENPSEEDVNLPESNGARSHGDPPPL